MITLNWERVHGEYLWRTSSGDYELEIHNPKVYAFEWVISLDEKVISSGSARTRTEAERDVADELEDIAWVEKARES